MSIVYSNEELTIFAYYLSYCDPNNTGIVTGANSVNFFKASQLSTQILKEIWRQTSERQDSLTKDEFYAALKLIALVQNGHSVDSNLLYQNIPTPMPLFQGINLPFYDISPDQLQKYENYFQSIDIEGSQIIQGKDARQILGKSGLQRELLSDLWRLCDINEKGYLTKWEFIVAIHLIGLSKKSIPLPSILPDNLISIMRRQIQGDSHIMPNRFGSNPNLANQQRFGSNSNIQGNKPRFGSNANIGIQPLHVVPPIQSQIIQPQALVSNVHLIPGYDIGGTSQIRHQINDNSSQLLTTQNHIKELYNSILVEQQEDQQQLQILNDNLKMILQNLQEQYRMMNEELMIIKSQKQYLQSNNQNLSTQIAQQLTQNTKLFNNLQAEQNDSSQQNKFQQQSQLQQQYQQPQQPQQQNNNFGLPIQHQLQGSSTGQQVTQQQNQMYLPNNLLSPFNFSPQVNPQVQSQNQPPVAQFSNDYENNQKPLQGVLKQTAIVPLQGNESKYDLDGGQKKQVSFQSPSQDDLPWS